MLRNCIVFFLLLFCLKTYAKDQPVILLDSASSHLVGKSLQVFMPDSEVPFETARSAAFEPVESEVPNFGTHKNSVWLKLLIKNNSFTPSFVLYMDNPTLDEVELFWQPQDSDTFKRQLLTKDQPLSVRKHKGSDFVFRLDQEDTQATVYYVRIKGEQPLILPVSVNLPNAQLAEMLKKNWLNGIYFGLVLIMATYNFFIYASVKDSSYLYYVMFICFAGITQLMLKGIAFQYFWPNTPFFEQHGMVLFASLSGAAGLLFTRQFLNLKKDFPILNKLIILALIPFGVSIILIPFSRQLSFLFMRNATTVGALIALMVSIYVFRKSRKASVVYFVVAWCKLIAGSIIYLLYNYGILKYSTFTNYSVQLSSAIEMTLLSLALASRINILEKEKENSRRTALRLARENTRIVKEQNIHLEEQVNKRTEELVLKNDILNETYEDLKQAQSKLVIAEKMSSLGQLTAGIAHEINNPINFVASNVSPLRRDFKALLDALEKIESIGLKDDTTTESKKKEIDQFKSDEDLDYLKTEIGFLLNGIQDGATRTAEIVKGLRVFSRVDEAELKAADVNDGIRSTLVIVNNLLHGITLVEDLKECPQILCYPGKLNQVFLNIITNAIGAIRERHGNEEGGRLEISTYSEGEDTICIMIKDNGIGMDELTLSKLYEPFFTTKKVGEGMGLGMSIVFSIIKEHNATILVDSVKNEGTVFTIKLNTNNN
ncbi:MAG: hypothetical protein BGO31_00495 [Bacteroidetes bacterium 43-16]|nr:MAG: hypothetical protein BGO31_00495 [Bacteroidetes bacterium 43-16]